MGYDSNCMMKEFVYLNKNLLQKLKETPVMADY
jgi:hypothetical protein